MAKPSIFLAFTDDWELRGDGSGDMAVLQFEPMQKLLGIFDKHGVKNTFMAEMMQQLALRREQERYPELETLADKWDDHIRTAYASGHDVQLHLHAQWSDARYQNGNWALHGDWSILNYEPDAALEMIAAGKSYLENLIRPLNPKYSPTAFRASYLAIAPSPFMLGVLADQGITLDLSLAGGLRVNTRNIQFDYTDCEEDFLPFYPDMADARRLSDKVEPVICVPIFQFEGSRHRVAGQIATKVRSKLSEYFRSADKSSTTAILLDDGAIEIGRLSAAAKIYDKLIAPILFGKHLTADVGQLSFPLLREMLHVIRVRARDSGESHIPVILTNHTKNMKDFDGFDRFLGEAAAADDISIITITELAAKIRAGEFKVKKAHEPA
jgi:hypothetical protein